VNGADDPPVFTSTAVTSARVSDNYVYNVRADDPDGNSTLTLSAPVKPAWLTTFTDQTSGSGLLSGTPAEADIGDHNVSLRVTDANGTYADQNFTIVVLPANYPPVIKVDNVDQNSTSVTMWEDNASSFSLTGLTASDQDDDNATLVWAVDTNASNGTAIVEGTGITPSTVTFTPNPDFNGTDFFVLKVTDVRGAVDTLTVNLNVTGVDDPPVVGNAIANVTAIEDDANDTVDLSNVFNDVDDDNASITKSVTSSNPSLVTASMSGEILTLDYQTDQNGTATITVIGTSNTVDVNDTFTVTVSEVDDPPTVVNAISSVSVLEDALATTIDLSNIFNDVDDDNASITKSATSSNTSLVTVSVTGDELTLHYQADQNGTATVTVRGTSNSQDVNASFVVTVTEVNDAPLIGDLNGTSLAYLEDDGTMILDANATVTDSDGPDFNGSVLTVAFASGKDASEDFLVVLDGNETVVAMDSANATVYDDAWTAADDGGSGFAGWTTSDNNDGSSLHAGYFIGDSCSMLLLESAKRFRFDWQLTIATETRASTCSDPPEMARNYGTSMLGTTVATTIISKTR
jgi:hypothetical protein